MFISIMQMFCFLRNLGVISEARLIHIFVVHVVAKSGIIRSGLFLFSLIFDFHVSISSIYSWDNFYICFFVFFFCFLFGFFICLLLCLNSLPCCTVGRHMDFSHPT
jgi:hypothetical protein